MKRTLFPVTVIDNFYEDPDYVRKIALENFSEDFHTAPHGHWPGIRTSVLPEICPEIYEYFSKSILSVFYHEETEIDYDIHTTFQLISQRHNEKYHPRNMGWIHTDGCVFAGLIYLSKNPEKDTGTSIYAPKNGIAKYSRHNLDVKQRAYRGEDVNDEEFISAWESNNSNFYETIKIENVYNRCILFDGRSGHHAAQTFGSQNKKRLTQVFFCTRLNIGDKGYPLNREPY